MKTMRRTVNLCDDIVSSVEMIQSFVLLLERNAAVANLHLKFCMSVCITNPSDLGEILSEFSKLLNTRLSVRLFKPQGFEVLVC